MPREEKDEIQAENTAPDETPTTIQGEPRKRISLRKSETRKPRPDRDRRDRDRKQGDPPAASPPPVIRAPEGAEDVLAHLSWRPRQARPLPTDTDQEPVAPKSGVTFRERKDTTSAPPQKKVAPVAARPPRQQKEPPASPKRIAVRIPEEAAQVILHEGIPSLVHNKRIVPPLMFAARLGDEKHRETILEEARMAAEKGIRLVSVLIDVTVEKSTIDATAKSAMKSVAALREANPDGLFVLRTNLIAPKDWDRRYKKARYKSASEYADEPSVCDDEFWSVAEECLVSFITSVRQQDRDGAVIGVHIDRDEWFYRNGATRDSSDSAKEAFSKWVRHRYRDDKVSLRAAWFDGTVDFDTATIPEPTSGKEGEEFVRTGRRARKWVDFNLFLSDATVDRIAKLAYAAKQASAGWFLVGVSYGYTFEWSHPGSGHLSLGKLLRCPDVDYIAGPPSYKGREPGGSAPFPCPIDSFTLNGKLYMSEDDFKTPISGGNEPDEHNPLMKTPQALEGAHWRSAGAALAHRSGAAWIDSWGNGWLTSRGIWERAALVERTLGKRYAVPQGETDVAVFVDERSLAYLVDPRAFEVLVQNVRESVLRSGLSASFYLLSDLAHRENFPEAKLYVFMNAWDLRPEVRSAIKTRLQRDNKVLFWLYCAGLFEAGRESLERVREVTGIPLKPQPYHSKPGTTLLNTRHALCSSLPVQRMADGGQLEPSYFAIPEDSTVFGEYSHTGLPSFVVKETTDEKDKQNVWTSVFLGEPVVTPGLFRALGQMAGAHVWNFDDDVVHIRAPFVTVHCKGAGPRTVTLPNNWSAYDLVGSEWASVESNSLRFTAIDGHTYVFLAGIKAEIETLLNADLGPLLTLEKIEPRGDDTVHWDAVQFDVQIMKLDEWVEETWSEQHADDLLLKPSMLDIDTEPLEEEQPETEQKSRGRHRGRGRRRRGGGRRGSEETASGRKEGADMEFDEAGIGVLFRKRQ